MWRQDEEPDHDPVEAEPAVLPELVEESAARHGARPAQRYKGGIYDRSLSGVAFDEPPDGEFATLTYEQLRTIVRRLAVGLRSLGLDPGQRVGLFAETRAEWAQCDLGTLAAGGVVVPIAPNLPTDRVRRRLTAVDGAGVVVENERLALRLLELIDELDLRFILSMDELPSMYDDRDGIYTLADVFEHGERYYRDDIYESWLGDHDPGSPASIVYSAGATDRPSRASLTHRNVLANVEQVLDRYGPQSDGEGPVIDEQTRTVSVLPLAYEFERVVGQFVPLAAGGCIGYADGPETLVEDCQALEPTMLTGVPALYERLYDDLRAHAADGSIGRRLFEWAANVGIRFERHGRPGVGLLTRRALADQLVFSENRAHLGGTLELLFSSGGTFSTELSALFHAMGLPIDQCYGLAEATSVATATPPEAPKLGTVGLPLQDVETRLEPTLTPDQQFDDVIGTVGELLLRGPNVADASRDATIDTVEPGVSDPADWIRTGDIVRQRPDGHVVFHERTDQLFTLTGGPTIAPSPIEDAFATERLVDQCVVVGAGRPHLGALIVPSLRWLEYEAEAAEVDLPAGLEAISDHTWVHERVQTPVDCVNDTDAIPGGWRIESVRLLPERLTVENGLLTPTLEPRRHAIRERYSELIDSMYELS